MPITCITVVVQIFILFYSQIACCVLQHDSRCPAKSTCLFLLILFAVLTWSTVQWVYFVDFFFFSFKVFEYGILKRSMNNFYFVKVFPISIVNYKLCNIQDFKVGSELILTESYEKTT